MAEPIIILGASARAAAFSALRAGFSPWTADLFADADLAARCPARRVDRYPADLEQAAAEAPPGPWMYTGALENHPHLVDRIAAKRPLRGNPGSVLRQVRNPGAVRGALVAAGLSAPELRRGSAPLGAGPWLRKPRRSAGGRLIERMEIPRGDSPQPGSAGQRGDIYYQQFIPGVPVSAVFVGAGGRASLLGVTRQLIGEAWTGAAGFQYAGSLGPLNLSGDSLQQWRRIGDCLGHRFALTGLFGVDAIAGDNGIYPVEVNPRYTASVEVLEQSLGIAAVAHHVAACRDGILPESRSLNAAPVCGKAIIYARRSGPVRNAFWRFVRECNDGGLWPPAADLPQEGQTLQAGHPVLTVLAQGENEVEVLQQLKSRVRQVVDLVA